MGFFKFNWFNSKERESLLNQVKQTKDDSDKIIAETNKTLTDAYQRIEEEAKKPFKNIYYSGNNITVVLKDGIVISKQDVDKGLFDQIRTAKDEATVYALLTEKVEVADKKIQLDTQQERDIIKNNLGVLKNHDDFIVENSKVYLKGVSLELPTIVAASFIEVIEKGALAYSKTYNVAPAYDDWDNYDEEIEEYDVKLQYQALKMFWLKLALNPIEQSRIDLLNFVRHNDVRITVNGNLVLYRRVVSTNGKDKQLTTFISQQYYRIKAAKKGPSNYEVYRDTDGSLQITNKGYAYEDGYIGNLKELYRNLDNLEENNFTAYHDKKMIIKVGTIYRIDESKINLNNGLCAAGGLHAAAVDYNYTGFGDIPVVVLVNPSKAITVPIGETGKLRTTEMFIACINDKPQGEHFDNQALMAFDEEYNDISIAELEEACKNKSFAPAAVQNEVSPITFMDMDNIRKMLQGRLVDITSDDELDSYI